MTFDGRVEGPFANLPAGAARLAFGLGERWENYHSLGRTSEVFAAGSLRRRVDATYAELYLPVLGGPNSVPGIRRLDFSLAVRGERYSRAGSTGNPKFDFLWQPLEHLSVRGSFGTSFTVARYSQTLLAYNALAIQRTDSSACGSQSCLVAEEFGASSAYRPERSTSYTLGIEWAAERKAGFRARSDFYSIHYRDRIVAPPDVDTLLSHSADYPGVVVKNPTQDFLSGVLARAATYSQPILDLAGPYDPADIAYYIDDSDRGKGDRFQCGV